MASLMALAILCTSLPMILMFSTNFVWPLLFWCSQIGDGAFQCSLYLSPNILDEQPNIFILTVNLVTLKPINHTALLCDSIIILRSISVNSLGLFSPLKCTCTPYFWQMVWNLWQMPYEYGTTIWHFFLVGWPDRICLLLVVSFCWVLLFFWGLLFMAHLRYLHYITDPL